MSNLESINSHLEELRKRLLRVVIVIGIITVVVLTFHAESISIGEITLYYPSPDPQNNIAAQITNHMRENLFQRCTTNSNCTRTSFLCSDVCFGISWHGNWNANNN